MLLKKSIILFFILLTSINANYLITFDDNLTNTSYMLCVKSYTVKNLEIDYIDTSDSSNSFLISNYQNFKFTDGYLINDDGNCYIDNSLTLGLSYQNFNLLMAFFGLLLGNTILLIFGMSFTRR